MENSARTPVDLIQLARSLTSESDADEFNDIKLIEEFNQSSDSDDSEEALFPDKLNLPVYEKIHLTGRGEKTSYDTFTSLEKLVGCVIDYINHTQQFQNRKKAKTNAFKVFLKEESGYIKGKQYLAKASLKWNEISLREKEYYKQLADMARFCPSLSSSMNPNKLNLPKARRVVNAVMFYIKNNKERIKDITDIKPIVREWKNLELDQKSPYMTMETWDRQRFQFEKVLLGRLTLIARLMHSSDKKSIPKKRPAYHYLKEELRKSFLDSGWSQTPGLENLSRKHYRNLDQDTREDYKRMKRQRERNSFEEFIETLLIQANVDVNDVKNIMKFSKHESVIDSDAEWENSIADLDAEFDF